jgi:retron-type reverse transcriptase
MNDHTLWERVCNNQNLRLAWHKVKEKRGGPGVDRMTLDEFEQNLDENINSMQNLLETGDYMPLPVVRIYKDKGNGTKRSIGIPVIRDKVVQQALLSVLSPIFEPEFLDCSFAYRHGRSALNALDMLEALIKEGYKWALDGDIENFFDSIDQDLLISFVAETVPDTRVLKLIQALLNARVFDNMSIHEEYLGITQGSVISPLLANVFLGYYIDANGKGPGKKAIGAISQKLHEIAQADKRRKISDRIEDLKQSIRGWTSYFHTCRGIEPENPIALIALIEVSLELDDEENAKKLISKRKDFSSQFT